MSRTTYVLKNHNMVQGTVLHNEDDFIYLVNVFIFKTDDTIEHRAIYILNKNDLYTEEE